MGERDFGRVREEFEERGRGREQERVEKREKIEINTRECTFEWVNESELEREREERFIRDIVIESYERRV